MAESKRRVISDDEIKEIKEAFNVLDDDKDGRISLDNMKTLLQSQFMVFTDAQATAAVQQLDEDHSGYIEYSEFEKYVLENNLSKPTADEFGAEMLDAFQMFDTDKNGFIDAEEFKTFMTKFGDKMSDEEVKEIMQEADTDGDGKIDYQEFCVHMSKSF
ncbi:calmodulin-like protein 3 [Physella acuta]|uniref:calmodulin-like protein 3 n=1 Tax=Physella acuta TaxID=109671 RepID=UPI0027DDE706|nr:calmodulin-like protein 3 [Physella acuta]XP_059158070.1 calmodulin-like protein 3 [Physella acuta]XP_059158071.1 calmodulin-like protein 3 [Physella acuta]